MGKACSFEALPTCSWLQPRNACCSSLRWVPFRKPCKSAPTMQPRRQQTMMPRCLPRGKPCISTFPLAKRGKLGSACKERNAAGCQRDPAPRLPHARNNPAGGGRLGGLEGKLRRRPGNLKSMAHAANKHKASQSPGGVWACFFCQATQAQTQWIACKRLEEGWHQRRREAASGLLLQSLQILRHHEGYDVPWSFGSRGLRQQNTLRIGVLLGDIDGLPW